MVFDLGMGKFRYMKEKIVQIFPEYMRDSFIQTNYMVEEN